MALMRILIMSKLTENRIHIGDENTQHFAPQIFIVMQGLYGIKKGFDPKPKSVALVLVVKLK